MTWMNLSKEEFTEKKSNAREWSERVQKLIIAVLLDSFPYIVVQRTITSDCEH